LFKVNFKDNDKVLFNGNFVKVKRGECLTSIRKLSKSLPNCSEMKLRTFLKLLQDAGTIELKVTQGVTHLIICNYDSYQTQQHSKQQADNTAVTQEQHSSNNNRIKDNKRIIKENKRKKKKPDSVKPESSLYTRCVEYWLKELHPNWVNSFNGTQGKSLKQLLNNIKTTLVKYGHPAEDEDVYDLFVTLCEKLPPFFKNKNLNVITAKYNEIIDEIKTSNGKKSKYSRYRS